MVPIPPQFTEQSKRNAEKAAARRAEILARLHAGETQTAIAQSLGVTRNVVWRIAKRARQDGALN